MTAFVDSHVHLADVAFADDASAVIDRARAAGARALVCIGESPAAALRAQAIAARFPDFVFHTCGVHPYDANTYDAARDNAAIRAAVSAGAVAVGECGLDYHYDHVTPTQQRLVLAGQIALAAELSRPLVLHTREAEEDTRAVLRDAHSAGVCGVLHCFTGTRALAEDALAAGWYISFSGIVTFKSWTGDAELRLVPDDRLLIESDAPYLAPVPYRGKRNESAYVAMTLARIAAVRDTEPTRLGAQTVENTRQLFGLPVLATVPLLDSDSPR
ncbi:MAG: TatD family hydrolase [Gemmatimonadaceae bacterium]|nr:TatD family hydrolase [Gemmatimonadaceae bacterium]